MRIIVLGTRGFPGVQGGVEIHCQSLYPALAKRGYEIIVFTRKPYTNTSIKEYKGVKLVSLPTIRNKYLEAPIHTFIGVLASKRYKPDVLHIHAIGPSFFSPLARILGLKVVMTTHGPEYERKKWGKSSKFFLRLGEYLGVKHSRKVIAISRGIAQRIKSTYKINARVIPNGVEITEVRKADEYLQALGLEKGKYVLAVGRFVPEKGLDDLICAFTGMACGWKLVIVGRADHEDKYSRNLKELAKKSSDVILPGYCTGKPLQELYSHAGLFVLPSYYEGLPLVLLEAMSYGLSCIVSNIAPNRELPLDEDRYFEPGDIKGLATKIMEFRGIAFSEEEKTKQIRNIHEKYNWDKIAEETARVYNETAGSRLLHKAKGSGRVNQPVVP